MGFDRGTCADFDLFLGHLPFLLLETGADSGKQGELEVESEMPRINPFVLQQHPPVNGKVVEYERIR